MLKKLPCTSTEVERSFSQLKKLLADDRNFLPENIEQYIRIKFDNNKQIK